MKKKTILKIFSILCLGYMMLVVAMIWATPDKDLAHVAFGLGNRESCESGPGLWGRHASTVAYAYFLIPGRVDNYQQHGRGIILSAMNAVQCLPTDDWVDLDTQRARRGIALGVKAGVSINQMGAAGIAPIHLAVMTQNPELLTFILENGGDVSLKTTDFSVFPAGMTPLEMARYFDKQQDMSMKEIIKILEQYEGA